MKDPKDITAPKKILSVRLPENLVEDLTRLAMFRKKQGYSMKTVQDIVEYAITETIQKLNKTNK